MLPESATTGYTPGVDPATLWDLVSEVPGPVTEPLQEAAGRLGVHLVAGTYERGAERGTVHNTAVLIGPSGDVLGSYRKTHVFYLEDRDAGGWVTRGDQAVVVDTELARSACSSATTATSPSWPGPRPCSGPRSCAGRRRCCARPTSGS